MAAFIAPMGQSEQNLAASKSALARGFFRNGIESGHAARSSAAAPNPRLAAMLNAPILPTLSALAWPNVITTLAQSSTGLVETWYLSHLGTDALAGMALVLPVLMLMQNMSQGAMGGGISSAIARALGGGKEREADNLVLQAVVLNATLGLLFAAALLLIGPTLYRTMGARAGALDAALAYSDVMAAGLVFMWLMNALASVVRGTGNMLVPSAVVCGGAVLLVALAPCLIFGFGPIPKMGIAGAGLALVVYYLLGSVILVWYVTSGRSAVRLRLGPLRWNLMYRIFSVGGMATINPILTNGIVAATTALVGAYAGNVALAGFGIAARLEYLIIPIAFGFGAPLVAMVSSNIGAGRRDRAMRIGLTGGILAFALSEAIGITVSIWPLAWMQLFGSDPQMLDTGATYLRTVGPFYGFMGMGFTLYFASQGAGQLTWPLLAVFTRLTVAVGVGWLALELTDSMTWFFAASATAAFLYGSINLYAVASRKWLRRG